MADFTSGNSAHESTPPRETPAPTYPTPVFSVEPSVKPRLTIKKEEAGLKIYLDKYDVDAVRIYCKRSSEDKFTLMVQTSDQVFVDSRPNLYGAPELREYMAYYIKNDKQVGEPSDVVLIIKK